MSVLYISRHDGTFEKAPVTPENTRRFLDSIPLYREDDDPSFWPRDKIEEMQNEAF